jgi:nucleotidyltransferase substrate binding protein (TIGR01987 family)
MSSPKDIRWHQRFSNYKKALAKLSEVADQDFSEFSDLEKEGLIQRFEYTHELAWNVMKDFLFYQGIISITGSRDATREAFKNGLISDGDNWMEMIGSRNKTSHMYNQDTADEIAENILFSYFPLFLAFEKKMEAIIANEQDNAFDKE